MILMFKRSIRTVAVRRWIVATNNKMDIPYRPYIGSPSVPILLHLMPILLHLMLQRGANYNKAIGNWHSEIHKSLTIIISVAKAVIPDNMFQTFFVVAYLGTQAPFTMTMSSFDTPL